MSNIHYLNQFNSRKVTTSDNAQKRPLIDVPDSLHSWMEKYVQLAVAGVRSQEVTNKIMLHLGRFLKYFTDCYGHDRISACLRRDVIAWRNNLEQVSYAPATINNHLASLSGFTSWVYAQKPDVFPAGDPAKNIGELSLPPLEPRALNDDQVRSLKNLCDRLERFHQLKGRRWNGNKAPVKASGRPWRDRAIVFTLLSTGLRREELVRLNIDQLEPNTPDSLRRARKVSINDVHGKGKTKRTVFLSKDARDAMADYIEKERVIDMGEDSTALFLSAKTTVRRAKDGRLSTRSINLILEQIGNWHDAEVKTTERKVSPLCPHSLRHTFAFRLARVTGADPYELQRRLGHQSQRYIQRYTNPPEHIAASYVEEF